MQTNIQLLAVLIWFYTYLEMLGSQLLCKFKIKLSSILYCMHITKTQLAPVPYNVSIISNAVAGLSILLAPGLHLIPIPIFFGVLLYLGVVSMYGLQMVDRFVMLFMPAKHHPDVSYVRKVRCLPRGTARNIGQVFAACFPKPLPHLRSKSAIFPTLIMTRSNRYPVSGLPYNEFLSSDRY